VTDNNVISMPTSLQKLAEQLRADVALVAQAQEQCVKGMMQLAQHLREARERFPSNIAFGVWLEQEQVNVGHDDRAAFIAMAVEPEIFREVLIEQSERFQAKTIWRKSENRFRLQSKTTNQDFQSAQTDCEPSTTPIQSVSPSQEVTEPAGSPVSANCDDVWRAAFKAAAVEPRYQLAGSSKDRNKPLQNAKNAALVKLLDIPPEQYTTVMSAYPFNRQGVLKAELGHLAKNRKVANKLVCALFERAYAVVKAGKAPRLSNSTAFDARIFLPDVPEAFCKNIDLPKLVRRLDRLDLLNNKAAELAAAKTEAFEVHNELHHIWETGAVRPPRIAKLVELTPDDSKNKITHPVKYCGEVIWPHESLRHVTYQDLNMGWHIADHWLKRLEVAKPQKPNELLVDIMHLIQDLRAASSLPGVTDVMIMCVQAYAKRNQRADKADLSDGFPPGKPR
jgi:hypothetical protein